MNAQNVRTNQTHRLLYYVYFFEIVFWIPCSFLYKNVICLIIHNRFKNNYSWLDVTAIIL